MKKFVVCLWVVMIFAMFNASAQAEGIAFVDIKKIMQESEAGKQSTQEVVAHVDRKRAEIKAKEDELEKLQDDLSKQKSVLTEAAFRERELDYQQKLREYRRFVEDANEEIRILEQRVTQALIPDIQKVIEEVAKRDGYTAIFDVGTMGLLYSSEKKDITNKVVESYDRSFRSKK